MITPTPEFWKIFKETNGALSCTEAVAIMNLAAQAPGSSYLELGTHKGKSAMAALVSLKDGSFDLVDPEFVNDDFLNEAMQSILSVVDSNICINPIVGYSTDVIPVYNYLCYVFVDSGSHQDGLPMQEALLLEDRVVSGGIIAWHDFRSQFREPAEAAEYLVGTGKYEWINIDWQPILDYVKEHNLEEGNNSWHQYPELPHPPNFVGAVKRK